MSTVVYKDGFMAADSRMTNGDEYQEGILKIGRTKNYLFGYAGTVGAMVPSFNWVKECEKTVEPPANWYKYREDLNLGDAGVFLVANRSGDVWSITTDGAMIVPQPRKWESIGSGAPYACGAIMMGADAQVATKMAISLDCGSGGDVSFLFFGETKIVTPGLLNP